MNEEFIEMCDDERLRELLEGEKCERYCVKCYSKEYRAIAFNFRCNCEFLSMKNIIKVPDLKLLLDKCEGVCGLQISNEQNPKQYYWQVRVAIIRKNNVFNNEDLEQAVLQALYWAKWGLVRKDRKWVKE